MYSRFNPYPVRREPDGSYSFRTENKITYGVVFSEQGDLFSTYTHLSHLFFDFTIDVVDLGGNKFPPKDFRTGDTIGWTAGQFLASTPDAALTYTCDDLDKKAHKRFLQFTRWFDQFNQGLEKHDYKIPIVVEEADEWGNTHRVNKIQYTSLMLSVSNSQRQALLDAFTEGVKDYQSYKS